LEKFIFWGITTGFVNCFTGRKSSKKTYFN